MRGDGAGRVEPGASGLSMVGDVSALWRAVCPCCGTVVFTLEDLGHWGSGVPTVGRPAGRGVADRARGARRYLPRAI